MEIALVSSFYDIPNEIHLLNLLFCNGLQTYHLRKDIECSHLGGPETYTEERIKNYIEQIPKEFRNRIILHSHFHLIDIFGLKGGHFTKKHTLEEYLHSQNINSSSHKLKYIGFSVHSTDEVVSYGVTYDYLFLSPIFDSISNIGYNSKFDLSKLKRFLLETNLNTKVIALGGMNDTKIKKVKELGFDGLSLLGHIWSTFEEDQNIISALQRFQEIKAIAKDF